MEIEVTAENFETSVLQSETPVLVDFWADWCMPCRMVEPVLAELAQEFGDTVVIGRVDVDDQGDLAARYQIVSIPSLLLFKGGHVVDQQTGAVPREVLAEMIRRHL